MLTKSASKEVTGVILAGGKSHRMGRDKAHLRIGQDTLIGRQLEVLRAVFSSILVSANDPEPFRRYGLDVIGDEVPEAGSLGGIYTSLLRARTPYVFVVACDMPLLRSDVIERMLAMREGHDVVVPKSEDGLEPLHALYSKNCLGPIRDQLEAGVLKIIQFFDAVRVRIVLAEELLEDGDTSWLTNINTMAEYEAVCRRVAKSEQGKAAARPLRADLESGA